MVTVPYKNRVSYQEMKRNQKQISRIEKKENTKRQQLEDKYGKMSDKQYSKYQNLQYKRRQRSLRQEYSKERDKVTKQAGQAFNKVAKSVRYNSKLSKNLLSYANGLETSSTGNQGISRGPGRPQGSLKHRSPFNGQPIPAVEFYRQIRAFRRIQSQKADQINEIRQRQFAQRGVQPNQIDKVIEQNLRRQFEMQQQMQNQRPINNQMIRQQQNQQGQMIDRRTRVWHGPGRMGIVKKDWGLFGPRYVEMGTPQAMFN